MLSDSSNEALDRMTRLFELGGHHNAFTAFALEAGKVTTGTALAP